MWIIGLNLKESHCNLHLCFSSLSGINSDKNVFLEATFFHLKINSILEGTCCPGSGCSKLTTSLVNV